MIDLGDRRAGVTLRFPFNTNAIAGESITVATNGQVRVYKDGGLVQSTTGATFSEDFDGVTGTQLAIIDTSQDGTFYSEGSDFLVMFQGATIDGKVLSTWVGSFSLANRASLMPTTAGRKLDVSTGGEAGLDLANVGSPTTALNLSGTTVKTATDVETDTANIQTRIPAALVGGRIDSYLGAVDPAVIADEASIAAAVLDEPRANHTIAGSFGEGPSKIISGIATGTPTTTTMAASALPSVADNQYSSPASRSILFTSGVNIGRRTVITGYTNSTRLLTFNALTTAPTAGDAFLIL